MALQGGVTRGASGRSREIRTGPCWTCWQILEVCQKRLRFLIWGHWVVGRPADTGQPQTHGLKIGNPVFMHVRNGWTGFKRQLIHSSCSCVTLSFRFHGFTFCFGWIARGGFYEDRRKLFPRRPGDVELSLLDQHRDRRVDQHSGVPLTIRLSAFSNSRRMRVCNTVMFNDV